AAGAQEELQAGRQAVRPARPSGGKIDETAPERAVLMLAQGPEGNLGPVAQAVTFRPKVGLVHQQGGIDQKIGTRHQATLLVFATCGRKCLPHYGGCASIRERSFRQAKVFHPAGWHPWRAAIWFSGMQ